MSKHFDKGRVHRVKLFSHLVWSPCKIWLLFLILCAHAGGHKNFMRSYALSRYLVLSFSCTGKEHSQIHTNSVQRTQWIHESTSTTISCNTEQQLDGHSLERKHPPGHERLESGLAHSYDVIENYQFAMSFLLFLFSFKNIVPVRVKNRVRLGWVIGLGFGV